MLFFKMVFIYYIFWYKLINFFRIKVIVYFNILFFEYCIIICLCRGDCYLRRDFIYYVLMYIEIMYKIFWFMVKNKVFYLYKCCYVVY